MKSFDNIFYYMYNMLTGLILLNFLFKLSKYRSEEVAAVQIGKKIRALRYQINLTQEELANRCELTKGYISQLENDLTSPSIATLIDILSALGTNLTEFFAEEQEEKIVFSHDDFIEKNTDDLQLLWLVTNAQKNMMEPISVELKPHGKTETDFPHEGEEFGYVLSGTVTVHIGNKKHKCHKGESFYFTASKSHYVENTTDKPAKFIWVSTPPTF